MERVVVSSLGPAVPGSGGFRLSNYAPYDIVTYYSAFRIHQTGRVTTKLSSASRWVCVRKVLSACSRGPMEFVPSSQLSHQPCHLSERGSSAY